MEEFVVKKKKSSLRRILPILIAGIAILCIVFFAFMKGKARPAQSRFQLATIARGNIENIVSSTGVIEAVGTVEIGTQVSGTISKIYVDFNDRVRAGQLLAVLDTVPLKASVLDAQANLRRAEALLEKAQYDYRQTKPLYEKGLVSESEYITIKTNVPTQEAALQSAKAALERAKFNLANAFIRAPISGTVIERNVEEGQTVAASFNTPKLFLIAEDLSNIEIHAQVDESDIGQIKNDLRVRFEVPAYPNKYFEGRVKQIRLQPSVVQNVVNYTVVVEASNEEGLLLPGMTATVDFLVEQRENVLLIANSALQFQPTPEMQEEARKQMQKRLESAPDSVKARFAAREAARAQERNSQGSASNAPPERPSMLEGRGLPENMARVWYLGKDGKPAVAFFMKGATDGKFTEILRSRDLEEGTQVIIGYAANNPEKKKVQASQPFRPPRMF